MSKAHSYVLSCPGSWGAVVLLLVTWALRPPSDALQVQDSCSGRRSVPLPAPWPSSGPSLRTARGSQKHRLHGSSHLPGWDGRAQ